MNRLGLLILFVVAVLIMFPVVLKFIFFIGLCLAAIKLGMWTVKGMRIKDDVEVVNPGKSRRQR